MTSPPKKVISPNQLPLKSRVNFSVPTKHFPKETLSPAINLLVYGVRVSKHYSSKLFHGCVFYILEDDSTILQWISHVKPYNQTRIDMRSIRNITDDPRFDPKLDRKFRKHKDLPKLLFVVHGSALENKVLILRFGDETQKGLFWQGLQHLARVSSENEAVFSDFRKILAKRLFIMADRDGDKKLDFVEVRKILRKLHIEINNETLAEVFEKYDRDRNQMIDDQEFLKIIEDITLKTELKHVFQKYCKRTASMRSDDELKDALMSLEEFQSFMAKEQRQEVSAFEFRQLLKMFNKDTFSNFLKEESKVSYSNMDISNESATTDLTLSFSEFCSIIFSPNNVLFDPEKQEVYQDMAKPLTDYFICTSHNTYLLNNQLTGRSSLKAYIQAFAKGCRCVELDCWEGEKGEPVIYHGYTLTSKILFRDVIETIRDFAFAFNPYPVILSLENHCSKQQDAMADILQEILGDSLYVISEDYLNIKSFPSPEELKYKVLVKNKGTLPIAFNEKYFSGFKVDWEALEENKMLECDDEEDYLPTKNANLQSVQVPKEWGVNKSLFSPGQGGDMNLSTMLSGTLIQRAGSLEQSVRREPAISAFLKRKQVSISTTDPFERLNSKKPSSQNLDVFSSDNHHFLTTENSKQAILQVGCPKKKEKMVSGKLRKLLALYGVKMSLLLPRTVWNVSSINENKFEKLCREEETQLQDFLRQYLLRTYPSGKRVDSSNYDPIKGFNFGVQMCALNMQTSDLPLLLYSARFRQNGGRYCGYVKKPDYLLKESYKYLRDFDRISKVLCLEVISGQQLRPENENQSREAVHPFVEVSLRGSLRDETENSKTFRSNVVMNNGFNPRFDLKTEFKLYCPDSVFLVFKVFHQKPGLHTDEKIGWNAIPFNCMRAGYRILSLLNSKLDSMEFSCLLVKVEISDVVDCV